MLLCTAGCHCSHLRDESSDGPVSGTDAGVRVTDCEDPRVWTSSLRTADPHHELGGGPCGPAQYPLHTVTLGWSLYLSEEKRATLARSCWRVLDAHERSGWSEGDVFGADSPYGRATSVGFERPIVWEGRVIHDDGTVAFAVPPAEVALDPARVTGDGLVGAVALMGEHAWASSEAVHLWGESIATEEVLSGASAWPDTPVTLHRGSDGFTLRLWVRADDGTISSRELTLGAGERVLHSGTTVALDTELLLLAIEDGVPVVRNRIELPAPPLELVPRYHYVAAHVPGEVLVVRRTTGDISSTAVGTGQLLVTEGDRAPIFFDGETFASLAISDAAGFDERSRVRPRPEHVSALGTLLAVSHGVAIGENGFMMALDEIDSAAGPRIASTTDVFGDGRIAHLADDLTTYGIERADGTLTVHSAPFEPWCD